MEKRGRRPLDIDSATLRALHQDGFSLRAIARRFDASPTTVQRHLKALHIDTSRTPEILYPDPPSAEDTYTCNEINQKPAHKATEAFPRSSVACKNPACDRVTKHPPYCSRCRLRFTRHGDPAVVLPRGRKKAI